MCCALYCGIALPCALSTPVQRAQAYCCPRPLGGVQNALTVHILLCTAFHFSIGSCLPVLGTGQYDTHRQPTLCSMTAVTPQLLTAAGCRCLIASDYECMASLAGSPRHLAGESGGSSSTTADRTQGLGSAPGGWGSDAVTLAPGACHSKKRRKPRNRSRKRAPIPLRILCAQRGRRTDSCPLSTTCLLPSGLARCGSGVYMR
jgi:hypothetical protein